MSVDIFDGLTAEVETATTEVAPEATDVVVEAT